MYITALAVNTGTRETKSGILDELEPNSMPFLYILPFNFLKKATIYVYYSLGS